MSWLCSHEWTYSDSDEHKCAKCGKKETHTYIQKNFSKTYRCEKCGDVTTEPFPEPSLYIPD